MQILAIDVDYREQSAKVAGVLFEQWHSATPCQTVTSYINEIQEYIPGQFYKRELPCIKQLLREHSMHPDIIVIDGFVYLDGKEKLGLGGHLYQEFNQAFPVIGVAKNPFKDIGKEYELLRGDSRKPLYITSAGISREKAKQCISSMHGEFRFPTLLKLVDTACRMH